MFKDKNLRLHFVGIGGIGMSGIAEILFRLGHQVSGSDLEEGERTRYLRGLGIAVAIGHRRENVDQQVKIVVYSSAVDCANLELERARELQIPLLQRAEMLAELMRLKYGIAVAGTHGKTTTSSILATIMHGCGIDITHIIGGVVRNFGGNAKLGESDFILVEADESDGSFLWLNPVFSIITNIDNDHLDYYRQEERLFAAFLQFSNKIPFYGYNICNIHDEKVRKLMEETHRPCLSYGIDTQCDYCAQDLRQEGRVVTYQLGVRGERVGKVALNLVGRHNVLNSLAAIAAAHQVVPDLATIISALAKFSGVGRRFEQLYASGQLLIVDDYAHHPTEIRATLLAARAWGKERMVVIFEPHRYSRTRDCWQGFIDCLKLPDQVFLLPIYPASEQPMAGITSDRLAAKIPGARCLEGFGAVERLLLDHYVGTNTLLLTLGAGAIGGNIRQLTGKLP